MADYTLQSKRRTTPFEVATVDGETHSFPVNSPLGPISRAQFARAVREYNELIEWIEDTRGDETRTEKERADEINKHANEIVEFFDRMWTIVVYRFIEDGHREWLEEHLPNDYSEWLNILLAVFDKIKRESEDDEPESDSLAVKKKMNRSRTKQGRRRA